MDKNKDKNSRKFWSADEKIGIIRKHISKAKIVETSNKNSVPPPTFSDWLKLFLETGRDALAGTNKREVRLTWMMVDKDIAYLSPSSVYRILVNATLNNKWRRPAGEPKKVGFDQPTRVHEHWHTDISYLNIKGTFVYLICVIDEYFRSILS
jgi:hypothetical protein